MKLERGWSSRFHFKLRTNTWKLPMWKVEDFMGPGKQQERSKTYRDAKLCSKSVDNTRNQNKLTSSFSSSGSKLHSTLVQYKKQTLNENSLLYHSNCNILSVERNKLEKSTFKFPSTAKSQTLGKLASRCVLKSTSSYRFLPFNTSQ